MKDEIKYSNHVNGDIRNFNWDVRFDIHLPDGYVGITQYDNGKIKECVLLNPVQVKALQMFLRANKASRGQLVRPAKKTLSKSKKASAKVAGSPSRR